MRCQLPERGGHSVFVARDLLAQLVNYCARVQLAYLSSKGVAERFRGLDKLLELDALLRTERRLSEQVVVGESVPGIHAGDRVDRLPLAGRLDLSGTQQRENEQAHGLEVPAKGLFRKLVGEEATACGVAVVSALVDTVQHLLQ